MPTELKPPQWDLVLAEGAALELSDVVVVSPTPSPAREFRLGPHVGACSFEADHAGTATVTVGLVEQEPGELLDALDGFFQRDPRTGAQRLERWNTLTVLGARYILREMRSARDGIELVFYDEASEDLKRYTGPIKTSRDRFTRAQVVKGLANECGVQSFIPEQNAPQPIADLSRRDRRTLGESRLARFNRTYPAHFIDQPGHVRLTASQVRAIAESVGLPGLAFEQIAHGESGYYPGVVQRDPGDGMVGYGLWQITPNAWGSSGKLLDKLKDLGGIPAMRNPLKNAAMAKFMFDISGLQPWYGTRYLTAEAISEAGRAPRGDASRSDDDGTVDRARIERFEFSVAARENYWDATERFASDVRWRRFTVFNHLVFASDTTLVAGGKYELDLDADWVDEISWQVTAGQRIDSVEISGRLRSLVPPGLAFAVHDPGPLYGTWLVRNFRRDLLDSQCPVTLALGRPRRPLVEPASTVRTVQSRSKGETGGVAAALDWARSKIGHYRESLGPNRGPELNALEASSPFGFAGGGQPWCAIFATTAAAQGAGDEVKTAVVDTARTWGYVGSHGYRKGRWNATPRPGDLLCIGHYPNSHITFIEKVHSGGRLTCIEGNTGAGQVERTEHRNRDDGDVVRPDYRA